MTQSHFKMVLIVLPILFLEGSRSFTKSLKPNREPRMICFVHFTARNVKVAKETKEKMITEKRQNKS